MTTLDMNATYYVRIKRNGEFDSYDITQLTDNELVEFFSEVNEERLRSWACSLVKYISAERYKLSRASRVLAEFAFTTPGRLSSSVEEAIKKVQDKYTI